MNAISRLPQLQTREGQDAFAALPREYRPTAAYLFTLHVSTLKDPLALCTRLAVWIRHYELTIADLKQATKIAAAPAFMGVKTYGEQGLMERIAEVIAEVIQERKEKPERERIALEKAAKEAEWRAERDYWNSPAGQEERANARKLLHERTVGIGQMPTK